MNEVELNIKRYEKLINKLGRKISFMEGFKKMFNQRKLDYSDENIIQHL